MNCNASLIVLFATQLLVAIFLLFFTFIFIFISIFPCAGIFSVFLLGNLAGSEGCQPQNFPLSLVDPKYGASSWGGAIEAGCRDKYSGVA